MCGGYIFPLHSKTSMRLRLILIRPCQATKRLLHLLHGVCKGSFLISCELPQLRRVPDLTTAAERFVYQTGLEQDIESSEGLTIDYAVLRSKRGMSNRAS